MKDEAMSLPETQLNDDHSSPAQTIQAEQPIQNMQSEHPFQNMQTELHSRGAVLTKAWSDLFSFITRYQAELIVKENSVEIAEREISVRKRQLDEMKPVVDAGNEEITKLQVEIQTNQRLLNRTQSELTVKEQMLLRVRSDLNCNMEMLEKSRNELLGKQTEVVRYRGDLERLKSELTIKQEQILIKDNLLKKLKNQLMKENTELREQLDKERKTLEMERKCHELTKIDLRKSKSLFKSPSTTTNVEMPNSPLTLDHLSVEQDDLITLAENKYFPPYKLSQQDNTISDRSSDRPNKRTRQAATPMNLPKKPKMPRVLPSLTSPMQKSVVMTSDSMRMSDSLTHDDLLNPVSSASDTFFPLSVSQEEDSKSGIDTSTGAMMESQRDSGMMPGTPSSGASDSNQGPPVPISGPIPSAGMLLGEEKLSGDQRICGYNVKKGEICGKIFSAPSLLKIHMRTHTNERPFECHVCRKSFRQKHHLKQHFLTHAVLSI